MAASSASVPAALPAKRKRAPVSRYIDDADLEKVDDSAYGSGSDVEADQMEDEELPNGDSVYGSRKKPSKTNTRKSKAKKRAKLTPSRPKKPQKPFEFMSLPAELRDYIYELALVDPEGITVVSKTKAYRRTVARGAISDNGNGFYPGRSRGYHRRRYINLDDDEDGDESQEPELDPKQLIPALLAVNKQVRAEATGYLYQQSIILEDTMALHTFLAAIGPANRSQVADLTIRAWGTGRGTHKAMNVAALTLLSTCTNLKSFNLDCEIGWLREPKNLARRLYRDGHYFFEAYGVANGKKDAAVEVLGLNQWNFDRDHYYSYRRSASQLPEPEEFKAAFQAELRKLLGC
ncbi:hypothetical protein LTR37_018149 [Vermiconidia calcicola]|uniref:Uncharacterized protein n=1 Tax=Vermiconidia calcicola TaxID=1690605 RepID=A0ACC3MHT7_9PEZI|nr:hypothetical protein LTR37_018149 [Vermiconidia calcicola]